LRSGVPEVVACGVVFRIHVAGAGGFHFQESRWQNIFQRDQVEIGRRSSKIPVFEEEV